MWSSKITSTPGLMSFNRFSRSANDNREGKGDENESAFHGRIPHDKLNLPRWVAAGL